MNVLSCFDGASCGQLALQKLGITFNGKENTTDDYYFAWDNVVHTDSCSECSTQVLVRR